MSVATASTQDHLAELLGQHQLLPPDLAGRLVARAGQLNKWLGQVAVEDNLISERELTQVLAEATQLPIADLSQARPDPAALGRLRMLVRGIVMGGHLYRLTLRLLADRGESLSVDATAFVLDAEFEESWGALPSFIGLSGCLERLRFAVDPATETFFFGPLNE